MRYDSNTLSLSPGTYIFNGTVNANTTVNFSMSLTAGSTVTQLNIPVYRYSGIEMIPNHSGGLYTYISNFSTAMNLQGLIGSVTNNSTFTLRASRSGLILYIYKLF